MSIAGVSIRDNKVVLNLTLSTEDELDALVGVLLSDKYQHVLQHHKEHTPGEWLYHNIRTEEEEEYKQYYLTIQYHQDDLEGGDYVPHENVLLRRYPGEFCFLLTGFALHGRDLIKQILTIKQDIAEPIYTSNERDAILSEGLVTYLPDVKEKHTGKHWDWVSSMSLEAYDEN